MCGNSETGGFRPVALYARKTKKPLVDTLPAPEGVTSWDMLGTNLT